MKNYKMINLRKICKTRTNKQTIVLLLVFVLFFYMMFAINPTEVVRGADGIFGHAGSGGGGGGGGAAQDSDYSGLGGSGGVTESIDSTSYKGGNGSSGTGTISGGGGGGSGIMASGGDANGSVGGAAGTSSNPSPETGNVATAGANGASKTGVSGATGGNGGDGEENLNTFNGMGRIVCANFYLTAGSGGNGGQQVIDPSTGSVSGPGGDGGDGGTIGFTFDRPTLTVNTKIYIKSGTNGQDGNGNGDYNGLGGKGGAAYLQCKGSVETPNLTIEKLDGGMDVDIANFNVTTNTAIIAKGTSESDFVITTVNVGAGYTLTIDNSEGELTIGTLNIADGGRVIVTNPIPNVAEPATIEGDKTLKLKNGYKATSTNAFTISGVPEATVSIDKDYGGKVIWNHDESRFYISEGLKDGIYPVNITVDNGINEKPSLTFRLIVGEGDNKTPINNNGNSPTDQTDGKNPQTNDSSELFLWIIIECMVLMGIGLYLWRDRKRI